MLHLLHQLQVGRHTRPCVQPKLDGRIRPTLLQIRRRTWLTGPVGRGNGGIAVRRAAAPFTYVHRTTIQATELLSRTGPKVYPGLRSTRGALVRSGSVRVVTRGLVSLLGREFSHDE